MNERPTKQMFLEQVKDHKLKIVKDDGIHRHIMMSSGSFNMWYEIITWPRGLCYSGDMGTFVFRRVPDMFTFFRQKDDELRINTGYWHEKLDAVDRCDGAMKYSPELFRENIIKYYENWCECETCDEVKCRAWERIRNTILPYIDDNEFEAFDAIRMFCKDKDDGFSFYDFYEFEAKDYTYRFIWCLYAIVHAIIQYDKIKL